MQTRFYLACLLAASVAASAGCGGRQRLKLGETDKGEVVEAEGLVPYVAEDLPGTKAGGLAAAQRRALEKVVGVYVAAQTRVKKAVTIDQRILSKTEGYIKKYDIISEEREGGFWKTRIRALVEFQELEIDLQKLGLMEMEEIDYPRVAVLLDESVDGEPSETTHGADGLTAALVDIGYTVLERSLQAGAAMQNMLAAMERGRTKAIRDLGSRLGVEVVIIGEGETERLDTSGVIGGFTSYRARLSAKAVRSGTGQILASGSTQASSMDVTPSVAAMNSLKEAGETLAEDLRHKIADVLQTRAHIGLAVRGIGDMAALEGLQKALRAMSGIESVHLRTYSKGAAELSLIAGPREAVKIAGKLSALASPKVRVRSSTSSRIEAEIVP